MTSKGLHGKLRQLYTKCQAEVQLWHVLQEQGEAQLRTCVNVFQRFPACTFLKKILSLWALQDAKCYSALSDVPGLQADLIGKQLFSLESLMTDLQATLKECKAVAWRVERLSLDASRQLKAEKLSPSAQAASLGAQPSLKQCVEGLQEINRMLRDEAALKAAILSHVTYDTSAEDLDALLRLFEAHPNLNEALMRDLLLQVLAAGD